MNILFVGDIVGKPGRQAVKQRLPEIRDEFNIDLSVVNAENAAGGSGMSETVVNELFSFGVDVITSGDHVWRNKGVFSVIGYNSRVLKPANYPKSTPGKGSCVVLAANGIKVGVINIQGRVFMKPIDCPFLSVTEELKELRSQTKVIIVDFHAEATSEKIAMGWYLDGKVSAVLGTHTHVPTADAKILPQGTAYITDTGMVGAERSVLGRDVEPVLKHFTTSLPARFSVATGDVIINCVVVDIDESTGLARNIIQLEK